LGNAAMGKEGVGFRAILGNKSGKGVGFRAILGGTPLPQKIKKMEENQKTKTGDK